MPTLTLEPTNDQDLHLLLSLAERLGIKTTLSPAPPSPAKEERMAALRELAGSWSREDATEIEGAIEEARAEQRLMDHSHREVEL